MRIFVWNVASWLPTVRNVNLRHGSIKAYFEDELCADIVCLQETKVNRDKLDRKLACIEGYESFWSICQTRRGYSGVATYVRLRYAAVRAEVDCLPGVENGDLNKEGRIVVTEHPGGLALINVYVPNAGGSNDPCSDRVAAKCRFLTALRTKADALAAAGRQVLLVGDFNIAPTSKDVHPCYDLAKLYSPREQDAFRQLVGGGEGGGTSVLTGDGGHGGGGVEDVGGVGDEDGDGGEMGGGGGVGEGGGGCACPSYSYTDVWRLLHPEEAATFTVFDEKTSARPFNQGLRIDYVLASSGLLGKVQACEVVHTPPKWSDHVGLMLELRDMPRHDEHAPPPPPCALSSRKVFASALTAMFAKAAVAAAAASSSKAATASARVRGDDDDGGDACAQQQEQAGDGRENPPAAAGLATEASTSPLAAAAAGAKRGAAEVKAVQAAAKRARAAEQAGPEGGQAGPRDVGSGEGNGREPQALIGGASTGEGSAARSRVQAVATPAGAGKWQGGSKQGHGGGSGRGGGKKAPPAAAAGGADSKQRSITSFFGKADEK